jgi:hypothetical protein
MRIVTYPADQLQTKGCAPTMPPISDIHGYGTVPMRRLAYLSLILCFPLANASLAQDQPAPARRPAARLLPGMQSGGSILLPNQWSLKPVGTQINLGDFPVNIALHRGAARRLRGT